ncbi:RNA methyltransferase, TrmA family [Dickeya chrysanthemi Ech1591]|uniref:23S rRNA (uracil(1939)-C(5))-methyltransferase RlmD n=1 Tax=Dickeya chrysanthemi (strain Ech1591) TaxID=561229 RepID=C6CLQ6_DICC1|nr:23S rRNA (uracil(1939)-C(5))-methyltransferase RlmD [Dickeya chrysanthemi]ACT05693.1 RNA methyltransferase, TrmA family [Dickeya chrysanthemi Ech1591]
MAQFYSPNRRVTTRQTLTVTVNDLDPFGQGVARHQGKTVFIPGVLPGEQAEVQLTQDKRQFAHAVLRRLLTTSDERVTPRCPHFSVCGGCQQQHVDQSLQHRSKAAALKHLMKRETGENVPEPEVIAGAAYGYRRRARLALYYQAKTRRLQMGYRQAGSHDLVDINACPILRPELEALLAPLRDCLRQLQAVRRLGHVELVLAEQGPLVILRHLDPLCEADRQALTAFAAAQGVALFAAPEADALSCLYGDAPSYRIAGLSLAFSPRDFIQVNDEINQRMVEQALAWLDPQPQDRVLDLFCGMGNFTLPLAERAGRVVGVEGVAALVDKGRENATRNGLTQVTFYHHNLEEDVTRQPWASMGFDKVLLDPARAGAPGVMPQIVKLAPRRVVYISCNPTTLARDSKLLMAAGYRLARLTMLDMFPHTGHLESMALFLLGSDGSVK